MPKKSKINIFNKMDPEELDEKLNDMSSSTRYYQRLVAMRLIEKEFNHKDVAEILNVSYRTVNRWAHTCEEEGLEGLKPNFSGGRASKLTPEIKYEFQKRLKEESADGITMMQAKGLLKDEFELDFSLVYVCKIVRDLGFNYGSPRPIFEEAEDNPEETLKKTLIWQK